jgi:hypothetical protein
LKDDRTTLWVFEKVRVKEKEALSRSLGLVCVLRTSLDYCIKATYVVKIMGAVRFDMAELPSDRDRTF